MPSPFTEAIYRDWEKLTRSKERTLNDGRQPHPDQIEGWQALYSQATKNGNWIVSASDAYLVASLGITLALQQFRFDEAVRIGKLYVDHPKASNGDSVEWGTLSTRLGIALLLADQHEEGLQQLRKVLAIGKEPFALSKHLSIRNDLFPTLSDLGPNKQAHPGLVSFVRDLLENWPEKEVTPDPVPSAATHGQLAQCLQSTVSRSN